MKLIGLMLVLCVLVGCSSGKVPKFDIGDKVIATDQVGVVIGHRDMPSGWYYSIQLRTNQLEFPEKDLMLQKRMDWNEEPCAPPEGSLYELRIFGVPPIAPEPTPAPERKTDKVTWEDYPRFIPTLWMELYQGCQLLA